MSDADHLERGRIADVHASSLRQADPVLAPLGIGFWERDLISNRVTLSPTAALVLGAQPDQAPPTWDDLLALLHDDDRGVTSRLMERAVRDRAVFGAEFRIRYPDNSYHWLDCRASILADLAGSPIAAVGVVEEIGAQNPLNAEAQGTETLGAAVRSLGHDFNNLLTTMLGYANLVLRTFEDGDQRQKDLTEIINATQLASGLARELLALGRAADGRARAAPIAPPAPVPAQGGERVLVVEDERAVRFLVRTILSRAGYEVHDAATPDEVEAWFAENTEPLDLMISDVMLTEGRGPEIVRRARVNRPGLKVLYMSGYLGEGAARQELVEAGAAFIQKPFTAEDLSRKVRDVLDGTVPN
jgi:CheY-like chemotaxis protein